MAGETHNTLRGGARHVVQGRDFYGDIHFHDAGVDPSELPSPAHFFTGRSREITKLRAAVSDGASAIAISGPPGVGKSALALQLAHILRHKYIDGQLYVRLRDASGKPVAVKTVLARFLAALGAGEAEQQGSVDALAARYRSRVARRKMLIILDDATSSEQVNALAPGVSSSLVLVTSRQAFVDCDSVQTFEELGILETADAISLLENLVGSERVAAEPRGAATIVECCGYLPLAVRIAGGRLRARPNLTIEALAARLSDESRRLDELRLGDREVRASLAISYAECTDAQRCVFRHLSEFPGAHFGIQAAIALSGLEPETGAEAVECLVEMQLIETIASNRFYLHDLTRLFSAERLRKKSPRWSNRAPSSGYSTGTAKPSPARDHHGSP